MIQVNFDITVAVYWHFNKNIYFYSHNNEMFTILLKYLVQIFFTYITMKCPLYYLNTCSVNIFDHYI